MYTLTNTYTHTMEYCSAIKKNEEILTFANTQMDFAGIMLNERRQKDKQCMISLICRI